MSNKVEDVFVRKGKVVIITDKDLVVLKPGEKSSVFDKKTGNRRQ